MAKDWIPMLLSIIYLIVLTALSVYIVTKMSFFSLPIPQSLKYATMMLPLGSGALLQLGWQLESRQKQKKRPTQFPFANLFSMAVLIASTTILTLLGTYAAPIMAVPGTADCSLELKWKALFRDKNAAVIRNIQDNFSCCGFRNAQHMAWPFPDRNHGADACESTFRRTNGCLPEWRSEQQKLAGLLMGCVVFLLIWVIGATMSSGGSKPWSCVVLRKNNWRAINDVEEHQDAEEPHRQQRTIDYLSRNERYSDNIEAQATGDVEQDRLVVPASRTTNMDMNIHGREEGEAH